MNDRLSALFSSRTLRARWQKDEPRPSAQSDERTDRAAAAGLADDPVIEDLRRHVKSLRGLLEGRIPPAAIEGVHAQLQQVEACLSRPAPPELDEIADDEHGSVDAKPTPRDEALEWRPD
ncbi:MAG: hypothetical protein VX624_16450, partial [Pseudomonadota bacterium]|nr:hypothetical protein [Pseudomonadota bacterium]